jgi:pimeloyl-ACP methyl ester carboxylesterase
MKPPFSLPACHIVLRGPCWDCRGVSRSARVSAAAAAVFVAAAFAGGPLIDARGGVAGALAVGVRTTAVAAGALALGGGFVLLASLRRRVRPRPLGWATTVIAWGAFAWLVAAPVAYAVYLTHLPGRRAVHDADLGRPKQLVALRGAGGVTIRGWYVASRNRAAVIALHGTGSNRNGIAAHARVLARHGYGVLALDLRGHGDSGGRSTSVPWKLDGDLDAAIAWLARRGDVDDRRIGALGVSLGGEVALQAAARRNELRAIVVEGVIGSEPADLRHGNADPFSIAQVGVMAAATHVLAGEGPGASDAELVERVAPRRLLLISAGPTEARINRYFARRGGETVPHWNLPRASHASAIRTEPERYERRVTDFLSRSLLHP